MASSKGILFGKLGPRPCKLCGNIKDEFGTLIDSNGHSWLICITCIDNLWSGNAAVITDEAVEERARHLIQDRLMGME